jgi:AcrR family transcriptional regulator
MAPLAQPTTSSAQSRAANAGRTTAPASGAAEEPTTAERILDAAEAAFAERGFAGTSLRDVASEVGIRIPSLYNHFSSKADLYQAVLARAIGAIQGVLDRVGRGELSNDARDVIGALMNVFQARPHIPRLLQYELLSGGDQLALVLDESVRPALGRGAEMLEQVSAGSRWKPQDRPLLLLAFYNLLIGHFTSAPIYHVLTGEDPHAPEAIERQIEFFGELVKVLVGPEQST